MSEKKIQTNQEGGPFLEQDLNFESKRLIFQPTWKFNSLEISKQANDRDIAVAIGDTFPFPYLEKQADEFKDYAKTAWEDGSEFCFGISKKDTKKYVGNIGFKVSEDGKSVSNVGYWLGKEFHGLGFATESLQATIDFILKKFPNVIEMKASFLDYNLASMNVLEKSGFVKTGEKEKKESKRDEQIKTMESIKLIWTKN